MNDRKSNSMESWNHQRAEAIYRPAALRAKQLRKKREMAEDKYEVAEDMAFAELISYAPAGTDAFHSSNYSQKN